MIISLNFTEDQMLAKLKEWGWSKRIRHEYEYYQNTLIDIDSRLAYIKDNREVFSAQVAFEEELSTRILKLL